MSQPSNTFSTYDAVGNREDLSNIIFDISPTETPFVSGIGKNEATSTKHEWQTHSLTAASDSNAVIEGDDATTDASTATTRLYNYTQISDKVARVTGTQDAVNSAGRKREMAFQVMNRGLELRRDIEKRLLANKAYVAGNDTTARETAGIEAWINTNKNAAGDSTAATGDGSDARQAGTARAFNEDYLKSVIQSCWNSGGNPDTIMVGGFNKQTLSGFTGNGTRFNTNDGELNTAVDVYISDFGTLKVVANRFQNTASALVLDMGMWKLSTLRPMQTNDLAKTGDSERKQIIVEYALEACNEAASGAVYDLTTS